MIDKKDTKKVDEKIDEPKLEGLKLIGGKDSYTPNKEVADVVYTSPVKIGDKEYIVKPLSMLDIKRLNIQKQELKDGDDIAAYDFSFSAMLAVVKKFNPEVKDLTTEAFEDMIDIIEFERIQDAILQLSGLKKYFKLGDSKK